MAGVHSLEVRQLLSLLFALHVALTFGRFGPGFSFESTSLTTALGCGSDGRLGVVKDGSGIGSITDFFFLAILAIL